VHFSHWGCRQSTDALRVVAEALQAEGVPLLVLDGDCVDARSYSDGQYRTRWRDLWRCWRRGGSSCWLPEWMSAPYRRKP